MRFLYSVLLVLFTTYLTNTFAQSQEQNTDESAIKIEESLSWNGRMENESTPLLIILQHSYFSVIKDKFVIKKIKKVYKGDFVIVHDTEYKKFKESYSKDKYRYKVEMKTFKLGNQSITYTRNQNSGTTRNQNSGTTSSYRIESEMDFALTDIENNKEYNQKIENKDCLMGLLSFLSEVNKLNN
ncbi:MAG: hypothetical protein HRT58_21510 [Crocinitomicaceae bacterium]|nr:hypothetical protein [Flavobacteriales bacterium]NQZ38252.1 hypothetical protein [Crocinitomicaceae bacterium]